MIAIATIPDIHRHWRWEMDRIACPCSVRADPSEIVRFSPLASLNIRRLAPPDGNNAKFVGRGKKVHRVDALLNSSKPFSDSGDGESEG